jgi:hypothetical protein
MSGHATWGLANQVMLMEPDSPSQTNSAALGRSKPACTERFVLVAGCRSPAFVAHRSLRLPWPYILKMCAPRASLSALRVSTMSDASRARRP